jgi:hypothetical protein
MWLASWFNWCYYGKETTIKDIFWDLDKFLEATKNPEYQDKFII